MMPMNMKNATCKTQLFLALMVAVTLFFSRRPLSLPLPGSGAGPAALYQPSA